MKKELTNIIKELKLADAIKLANNPESAENEEVLLASYMKLTALDSAIHGAVENIKSRIEKNAKKNKQNIDLEAELPIINKDGTTSVQNMKSSTKEITATKDIIDFDQYKVDNNIEVISSGNLLEEIKRSYPEVATVIVAPDKKKLEVFKTPTLYGNDSTFKSAIGSDSSLIKYKTTKVTKKYGTELSFSPVNKD